MKEPVKSFLIRSYIVLLMISLAVNVQLFPLKTLYVHSVPLPLFVFLIGMVFCLIFCRDFLRFLRERKVILIFMGLFLVSGILSAVFSPFSTILGLKSLFQYGLFFGISFLLLFLFSLEEKSLGLFFLKSVAGLAILLAFLSFFEVTNEGLYRFLADTFRGGEYQIFNGRVRAGATLTHSNIFGCFMSLGIFVFLYLKGKGLKVGIFYPAVFILAAAMALSCSRNAVFVLLVPVFLLLLNRKTVKTAAFVIAIAVFSMVVLTPSASRFAELWKGAAQKQNFNSEAAAPRKFDSVDTRLMLWQSTLRMFRDYPLTGIGPGGCNRALKKYASPQLLAVEKEKIDKEYLNAHNGFFNVLAEFGLSGTAVALAFAVYLAFFLIRLYGFFPPLPVHAILIGIVLSFCPDAFFYSLFYMVLVLTLFLLFAFPGKALRCCAGPIPSDKPAS
jgi:O-antigen ligase